MTIKVGVLGCTGRMGENLVMTIFSDHDLKLTSAVSSSINLQIGKNLSSIFDVETDVVLSCEIEDLFLNSDVIIDFSVPGATMCCLELGKVYKKPVVTGTTGLNLDMVESYGSYFPVLWSANMSIGINLVMKLVEAAAIQLGCDYDAEIWEMHHSEKRDSPSGTALMLGNAIANGRNQDLKIVQYGSCGKRQPGEIGIAVSRGGGVIGDHSVIFANDGERVEISHKAINRTIFVKGAIKAAKWLFNKPSGFYTMRDVVR